MTRRNDGRHSGIRSVDLKLLLVIFTAVLPALMAVQRPFHIDDTGYLLMAEHLQQHPLDPFSGGEYFCGVKSPYWKSSHPLLFAYIQSGIMAVWGWKEIPHHLLITLTAIAFGTLTWLTSRRFSPYPLFAAMCILVSPVYVVSAASCMHDIPTLILWLMAILLFEPRQVPEFRKELIRPLGAGCFAGMAALVSYYSLMIPVLFVFRIIIRPEYRRRILPALAGFSLVFGGWITIVYLKYGMIHPLAAHASASHLFSLSLPRVLSILAFAGAILLVPILPWMLAWKPSHGLLRLGNALLLAILGVWLVQPELSPVKMVLFLAFSSSGIVLMGLMLETVFRGMERWNDHGLRLDDTVFLGVWFLVFLLGILLTQPNFAARYLLPVLPPAIWLLSHRLGPARNIQTAAWLTVVVPGAVLSMILWTVDYQMASVYPKAVTWARTATPPNADVRFSGEFGLRAYAQKTGILMVSKDDPFLPLGAYVVVARHCGPGIVETTVANVHGRLRETNWRDFQSSIPVRLYNLPANAGFYSFLDGILPWTLSRLPLESLVLYQTASEVFWREPATVPNTETGIPEPSDTLHCRIESTGDQPVIRLDGRLINHGTSDLETGKIILESSGQQMVVDIEDGSPVLNHWKSTPGEVILLTCRFIPEPGFPAGPASLAVSFGSNRSVPTAALICPPTMARLPENNNTRIRLHLPPHQPAWQTKLAPNDTVTFYPGQSTSANYLMLASSCGNSAHLQTGTELALIQVVYLTGDIQEIPFRVGEHTAEWAWSRPFLDVKHRRPAIAWSYPVTDSAGDYLAHVFTAGLPLAHSARQIRSVTLRNTSPATEISMDAVYFSRL